MRRAFQFTVRGMSSLKGLRPHHSSMVVCPLVTLRISFSSLPTPSFTRSTATLRDSSERAEVMSNVPSTLLPRMPVCGSSMKPRRSWDDHW